MKRSNVPINKNDREKIWVHTDFKRYLKSQASLEGKSILAYTREAAQKKMNIFDDKDDATIRIDIKSKKPRWEKLF